jgi:ATP-dependent DNA ligase
MAPTSPLTSCRGSWRRFLPAPDGHSDFAALRTTLGAAQASFVAFDLLQFTSEDWRKPPLEVLRAQLGSLVAGIDRLAFSEALNADGAIVFAHARELGLEGMSRSVWAACTRAAAVGTGSR